MTDACQQKVFLDRHGARLRRIMDTGKAQEIIREE